MLKVLTLLTIATIWPSSINAIPAEKTDWDEFIQSGTTNFQMKMNGDQAIKTLNQRIIELTTEMSHAYASEAISILKSNQLHREQYARSKCEFLSDSYRGGTHQGLAYAYAYIEEQVRRIEELKSMRRYREEP